MYKNVDTTPNINTNTNMNIKPRLGTIISTTEDLLHVIGIEKLPVSKKVFETTVWLMQEQVEKSDQKPLIFDHDVDKDFYIDSYQISLVRIIYKSIRSVIQLEQNKILQEFEKDVEKSKIFDKYQLNKIFFQTNQLDYQPSRCPKELALYMYFISEKCKPNKVTRLFQKTISDILNFSHKFLQVYGGKTRQYRKTQKKLQKKK